MTAITVSGGGFTPEIFSQKVNINLDNYGAYNDIVNRKYEGEIKSKGDSVTIYTLGSLSAANYDPEATSFTGISYQDPAGETQKLEVDQQKIIPFKVGDIHKLQSNIELTNQYALRAGVAAANTKDSFLHGLAVAGAGTKLNVSSAKSLTADNIWSEICTLHTTLAKKNAITKQGLDYSGKRPALVITPDVQGVLLQADEFFANAFGDGVLRTGQIGHIGIFDVFLDTNIETTQVGTGTAATYNQTIVALTSDAISFAEQITKTETLRDKDEVADFVRVLHVYGGKVINANAIVTDKVSTASMAA